MKDIYRITLAKKLQKSFSKENHLSQLENKLDKI